MGNLLPKLANRHVQISSSNRHKRSHPIRHGVSSIACCRRHTMIAVMTMSFPPPPPPPTDSKQPTNVGVDGGDGDKAITSKQKHTLAALFHRLLLMLISLLAVPYLPACILNGRAPARPNHASSSASSSSSSVAAAKKDAPLPLIAVCQDKQAAALLVASLRGQPETHRRVGGIR